MGKFTTARATSPLKFNGDEVTATLRAIKRKHFVGVLPILQRMAELKSESSGDNDPRIIALMGEALDVIAPVMSEYVVEFKGPLSADGTAVPLDVVMDTAYFLPVALHLTMELVGTANVTEEQAGKSAPPSAA